MPLWKVPLQLSCRPPLRCGKAAVRSPQSLLFYKLNRPKSLSLSSEKRCSIPLIIFVALLRNHSNSFISFLCWGLQSWTQHPSTLVGSHQSRVERQKNLPQPAVHTSFDAAQDIGLHHSVFLHSEMFLQNFSISCLSGHVSFAELPACILVRKTWKWNFVLHKVFYLDRKPID